VEEIPASLNKLFQGYGFRFLIQNPKLTEKIVKGEEEKAVDEE
jgi:hypothetical protein